MIVYGHSKFMWPQTCYKSKPSSQKLIWALSEAYDLTSSFKQVQEYFACLEVWKEDFNYKKISWNHKKYCTTFVFKCDSCTL